MKNKHFKKVSCCVAVSLCLLLLTALPAMAAMKWVNGTIEKVLIRDENFGTCLVMSSTNVQDILPECKATWVTLSCDGTFGNVDTAVDKLKLVELAFALEKTVGLYVDDARMHNGYCYAEIVLIYK